MRAHFCRSGSGTWARTPLSSTCTAWGVPYMVRERRRLMSVSRHAPSLTSLDRYGRGGISTACVLDLGLPSHPASQPLHVGHSRRLGTIEDHGRRGIRCMEGRDVRRIMVSVPVRLTDGEKGNVAEKLYVPGVDRANTVASARVPST